MARKYTEQELEYILNNYKIKSNLDIGEEIGVSRVSIHKILQRRKLHRTKEEIKNICKDNSYKCCYRGKDNTLFGKPRIDEVKQKISKELKYKTKPYKKQYTYINKKLAKITNSINVKSEGRMKTSHFVWCNEEGNLPYIPEGYVIHHLDLNPENNSPDNLFLLPETDHLRIHSQISLMIRGKI